MSLHQQSCTLCLGLDAKTLEQVKWSHQTWMKNCPELFRLPWVIFYDDQHLTDDMILDTLPCPSPTLMIPWNTAPYGSQREAMLTGFCFVPPMAVRTDYWMKLDTDSVCLVKNPNWFDDRWFDRDEGEATNAYVASSWSYTKAKGDDRSGAEWAEALEVFGDAAYPQHPRLGLAEQVDGQRIRHRRMASWISFYDTAWTKGVAEDLNRFGGAKLPVPSQDTVHWYAAARCSRRHVTTKFKRRGWTNVPRLSNLIIATKGIIE